MVEFEKNKKFIFALLLILCPYVTIVFMKTIDEDIKLGQLKNVYVLYGAEAYLLKQYKDKLVKAMVNEGDNMNFTSFTGKDISTKEVIDLAETMPFLSDRRVILIEDSGFFKSATDDLADYMEAIPETTFFIFAEKEVDKRNRLYKACYKAGKVVEFETQNEQLLARWIGSRIKKEGKNITNEAYQLFIAKTGTDMENIDKELEKLICYTLDKATIEASDVEAITTEQISNKVFEMVDSIALHNQAKALDLYYDLLALKEPAMRILFLIARQFQILFVVKVMTSQNFAPKEIAAKAGCPEWAVKKNQNQCRGFTGRQLKEAIEDAVDFEEAVKTGRMNDQMAVELFIVKYSKA